MSKQNLMRTIMSEFALLWCNLEDARPQKLRAYGTINPLAKPILGPRLQRLIDLALAIDSVARGKLDLALILPENEGNEADEQG